MLEQRNLLGIGQPAGLHGCVGEEEESAQAEDDRQAAKHDKHDAPASKTRAGRNVLEAVRNGAADDLAKAETQVPEGEARGLFGLGVPLAADEHQRGSDGGLEDTEEDAGDEQRLVVLGRSSGGRGDAPKRDVESEPLGGRDLLQEIDWRAGVRTRQVGVAGWARLVKLTVGDFEAEQANEEKGRDVGEVVAL